ncbi:MAG: MerR family transcriptional regulator, partial [Actinomycetota bacterium]
KAIRFIADELKSPLEQVTLMSDGKSIYAATSGSEIVDLLQKGQGVFGIALGRVYEELEGAVKRLAATPEPATVAHATGL